MTAMLSPASLDSLQQGLAESGPTHGRAHAAVPARLLVAAAVAGGVVGAAMVLLAALALGGKPAQDPQLAQVVHSAGELTEASHALADKIRSVETELVADTEAVRDLADHTRADRADLAAVRVSLSRLTADGQHALSASGGLGRAVFGVTVAQLADAIDSGRPLEWELVNMQAVAGDEPALAASLGRLAPMAANGVPTRAQLAQAVGQLAAFDARQTGPALLNAGLTVVGRVLGPNVVRPPGQSNAPALARAAAMVDRDDMAGLFAQLKLLGGATAAAAGPLLQGTEFRQRAAQSLAELQGAARSGLETAVGSVPDATVTR